MKKRKNQRLYQAYRLFKDLQKLKVRLDNQTDSVAREVSNFDLDYQYDLMKSAFQSPLRVLVAPKNNGEKVNSVWQSMVTEGQVTGSIWDWLLLIKGIAESTAAQLLALIDDPGEFATISKLWRYAGYGTFEYWVDEKGKVKAPKHGKVYDKKKGCPVPVKPEPKPGWKLVQMRDRGLEGYCLPYNKELKSLLWNITTNFVKHRTPIYREIYDSEKERQARINPELSKAHINNRAMRKVSKVFLQHVWVVWRTYEGLPVSKPYQHDVLCHTHYIAPPNFEPQES